MRCKIHNKPATMVCARCGDSMCPLCAEFIDGAWFCPDCAIEERRFIAGLRYRDIMIPTNGEGFMEETSGEADIDAA